MRTPLAPLALLLLILPLLAGCHDGGFSIAGIEVKIEAPDPAPASASVTAVLEYEEIAAKRVRLDLDAGGATVTLSALVAALDPSPFARIAHATDAQVREERGFLFNKTGTRFLERITGSYIPAEGVKRQPLQEANSPYVWLATVLTLNELHQAGRPIDFAIHTGDAVEIGLASELNHFLYVSRKLEMPFFVAAGNHDLLGFGIWTSGGAAAFGFTLDDRIDVRTAAQATFTANMERLTLDRPAHAATFREISTAIGTHTATFSRYGSVHSGYDLAPQPDDLFYTVVVKTATASAPGLQLIVLETTDDRGGSGPGIDARQLAFLNDTLDSAEARQNIIVVAGHHPLLEVHRRDGGFGAFDSFRTADPLRRVLEMLSHYPNVALYLTGHTHLPEVVPVPVIGPLQWVQVDSGSLLIHPQEATLIDLLLPASGQLEIKLRRFREQVDPATTLGMRAAEGHAAAAADSQSRPRYATFTTLDFTKTLPAFPVTVSKFPLP